MVLALFWIKGCQENKTLSHNMAAAHAEVKHLKTKDGLNQAKIQTLVGTRKELLQFNAESNKELKRLQEIVRKAGKTTQSAMVMASVTAASGTGKTTITGSDILAVSDTMYIYPQYQYTDSCQWHVLDVTMNKDSTRFRYKVFNDYDFITRLEKQKGLFKPRVQISTITNLNPNTHTQEIRTFQSECRCRGRGWFAIGIVSGAGIMYLIKN